MATLVPIPKLGQSEETVSIVKWHKAEGDQVNKGDVLFEVETDKAVLEVESQFEGTLLKIAVSEGREVPVMTIAAVLGEPGEPIPPIPEPEPPAPKPAAPTPLPASPAPTAPVAKSATQPSASPEIPVPPSVAPAPQLAAPASGRKAISPRARKYASRTLIRVEDVPGTGPGGRVVQRDVDAYLEQIGYKQRKITPAALNLAKTLGFSIVDLVPSGVSGRITVADVRTAEAERPRPMSKMRQTISRRLLEAKQNIPHFYVTVSVDMTDLVAYRGSLRSQRYSVSFNDFIIKAVALTLREFPDVNAATDDGLSIRRRTNVNVGFAVSIESGLVVPVLQQTDRLALDEVHALARELADKARAGKLSPDEMSGGTFSISNMGMMNVENFAAIINPGESGILAVSSIVPTPVVNEERKIIVRDLMKVTLSADHRVVDGALGAAFVNGVKRKLEDLALWENETGIPATA